MKSYLDREDLQHAYHRARKGKSKKAEIIARDENLETNIKQLYDDIVGGRYRVGRARRYIIQDPVVRELVVIPFRDRIVQHLLYGYLLPLFEPQWIHDSYANRVGKGTLFGIRRVERMMRSCSQQYTQDARVLKCDIQSCFMSMDRRRVWQLITTRVFAVSVPRDKSLILSLVSTGLFHDYMRDRDDHTTPYLRSLLPYHKSMLACKSYCCLPLGNLTSHLYANIILHQLDLYIKHELKIYHYGRYVDDFVCFHVDHHYLRRCITKIATFLMSIGLQLHPDKIYVQDYRHGIVFLGVNMYPYRTVMGSRIIACTRDLCYHISHGQSHTIGELLPRINSYLGLIKHHDSLYMRKRLCRGLGNQILKKIDFYHPYHKIIANPKALPRKYQGEYWLYALI